MTLQSAMVSQHECGSFDMTRRNAPDSVVSSIAVPSISGRGAMNKKSSVVSIVSQSTKPNSQF